MFITFWLLEIGMDDSQSHIFYFPNKHKTIIDRLIGVALTLTKKFKF